LEEHLITDAVDFVGEWSLPDRENSPKIAGTLSWLSGSASLQLHDSFTPLLGSIYGDEVQTYQAVHGTSISSRHISILRATRVGTGLSFGSAGMRQTERLASSWVVAGAHVLSDTLYSEIDVRLPGLQIWISRSGIRQTIVESTETNSSGVVYYIENLADEVIEITCLNTTLVWGIRPTFSGDLISEVSVKTSAVLQIKPRKSQSLDWYIEQLGKITTLLTFLAGSPMSPARISAKVTDTGADVDVLVALGEAQYCTFKTGGDFYMLRSNMGVELGGVFAKWFEQYETIAMPSQLALSVLCSDKLWSHVEFLTLLQALEGFHRATMSGLYASEAEYESISSALSNAIPKNTNSDHKEALKSRIKYGNEVSLRKRLEALVMHLPKPIRVHILGGEGNIPRSWIVTRNYYTHWDEASRGSVLEPLAMHRAAIRMRHLLRVLYLDFVGVPHSAIENSLRNANSESQYLIQLNNAEYRAKNPGCKEGAIMRVEVETPKSID
jgi:ApeA N-terminal domain 1